MHKHRFRRLTRLTQGVALVGLGLGDLACSSDPPHVNAPPNDPHINAPKPPENINAPPDAPPAPSGSTATAPSAAPSTTSAPSATPAPSAVPSSSGSVGSPPHAPDGPLPRPHLNSPAKAPGKK